MVTIITEQEIDLLLGTVPKTPTSSSSSSNLITHLANGEYKQVLTSSEAQNLFGISANIEITDPKDLPTYIKSRISTYLKSHETSSSIIQGWQEITWIGIACLLAFIQNNWTGPQFDLDPTQILPQKLWKESETSVAVDHLTSSSTVKDMDPELTKLHKFICKELSVDGEEVYTLTPRIIYLYLARQLLIDQVVLTNDDDIQKERGDAVPSGLWWANRCLRIQQEILDNPASTLMNQLISNFDIIEKTHLPNITTTTVDQDDNNLDSKKVKQLRARFHLERGLIYHICGMNHDGYEQFKKAQEASRLVWKLTGAKGKRTKFQSFDVEQLFIVAENEEDEDEEKMNENYNNTIIKEVKNQSELNNGKEMQKTMIKMKGRPDTVLLNDDTLLENIEYTALTNSEDQGSNSSGQVDPNKQKVLSALDQCLLLAFCLHVKNENPVHGLTTEEMLPYVSRVLVNPNNWMVHTMALLLRSRLEANKSRTVERSVLQMQTLVDQTMQPNPNNDDDDAGVTERLAYFFSLKIPSRWEMERELAKRFMSLGVLRSALDIFERLQMWDETISCYQLLEQKRCCSKTC